MRTTQDTETENSSRNGVVAPFIALLIVPLMSMVAFMVDYGYLTVVESNLQRAADAAALGGVMDLVPNPDGSQNFALARKTALRYANFNMGYEAKLNPDDGSVSYGFRVLPADIVTGKYDPTTINGAGPVTLDSSAGVIHDTMRVTVRRDTSANSPVTLFFAQVMGIKNQNLNATATAALRKPEAIQAEGDVLPFAIPLDFWNSLNAGDDLSIYNDNKIRDEDGNEVTVTNPNTGAQVPGNWGTVDLGFENNSTHDLAGQIINGLRQADVDSLYAEGRIPDNTEVPLPLSIQADPGLSQGMSDAVSRIIGQKRIIPIYDLVGSGNINDAIGGNTVEFRIVRWGVLRVTDSVFQGNVNTHISAEKAYTYDGSLVPREDLSDISDTGFDNIFASPVLVR